jgi:hypothetical protein
VTKFWGWYRVLAGLYTWFGTDASNSEKCFLISH